MYPEEVRAEAVEAVRLGFSLAEAAELVGCSKSTVGAWVLAAGAGRPGRGGAVHLPYDTKVGLVARYKAGERAADLGRGAGVTGCAVTNWARRLREEGVLSLMAGDEIRAAAPEPAGPPSELEGLRRRCGELELENAILRGTVDILKKTPAPTPRT
ncbi:helix-turn-helix domain-containing protein [Thermophilibacter provencensis]|uniref:helix-turn-helix domain-containing protein n=1 Tax=Thermophilibacter provencensis TaxID=1852386 RepID=UPI00094AD1DC|nr:helix-turn-helix domain-containing protein [Thermophilibacter provencensis]